MPLKHPIYNSSSMRCEAPIEKWRVLDRNCNYSKFNGSRYTPSAYSLLLCMKCGWHWRTKANYVTEVTDATATERMR